VTPASDACCALPVFKPLADWVAYGLMGLSPDGRLGPAVHFFVEDTTKIFALLIVMIYVVALARAGLNVDRVRHFLKGRSRFFSYFAAAGFGAVTPFCSCSSIPLFLGFSSARIPIGITMSFLVTSPLINEVAILLLTSLLGLRFALLYVAVGMLAGVVGGAFFDLINAERFLTPLGHASAKVTTNADGTRQRLSLRDRHDFAKSELATIFGRVWKWVFIGVGAGAMLHGFVPERWIIDHLGSAQWWSVPAAVLVGIPLYANATGIIPVAESLLSKGLPVGTTLAFMMSTVAASFPEFMLLKQVMKLRLLVIFFFVLLVLFTSIGWIFNLVWG
jgi:uncharacterized membrane protein YraQ (UPF0718 family)